MYKQLASLCSICPLHEAVGITRLA